MAAGVCNLSAKVIPSQIGQNSIRSFFKPPLTLTLQSFNRFFAAKVQASSAALLETKLDPVVADDERTTKKSILACPICYEPFILNGATQLSVDSAPQLSFQCCSCRKGYSGNETHFNLTVSSGANAYGESLPASTEIFRTRVVSFLYERGWRQTFSILGGFPGAEKEFDMMKDYLKPVLGGNIVDASCGSGLFSRLFAKSGLFSLVVALDYSENMLRECYRFINQEENFPKENFILVRADISRLPFATSSIDAVHAGAALHCWPSPSAAVAEISRVLRPGGVFVATTYILDGPFSLIPLLGSVRQSIGQISGSHIFLSERELEELCVACGLVDFTVVRNRRAEHEDLQLAIQILSGPAFEHAICFSDLAVADDEMTTEKSILACPICDEPFIYFEWCNTVIRRSDLCRTFGLTLCTLFVFKSM